MNMFGLDPQAKDGTLDARFCVKLRADNLDTLITASLAARMIRGEEVGIQEAEKLSRNLNIESTPAQILDQAKQLAESNSERMDELAQKTDAQLYRILADFKMRENYINAQKTAGKNSLGVDPNKNEVVRGVFNFRNRFLLIFFLSVAAFMFVLATVIEFWMVFACVAVVFAAFWMQRWLVKTYLRRE